VGPANANEIAAALVRCTIKLWPACQPGIAKSQVANQHWQTRQMLAQRPPHPIRSEASGMQFNLMGFLGKENVFNQLTLIIQLVKA